MKTIGYLLVCFIVLAGTLLPVPASASGELMFEVDKSYDMDSAVALAFMESPLLDRLTREAGEEKKGKGEGRKRVKSSKKKEDKKKNGKDKKGKKIKKNGKTGKKGRSTKQDTCPVCVQKLRDLALVFGNQARNVYRQARRSLADIDMIAKKKAKSGDFTLHLNQLLNHLNQTLPMQNPPVPPVDCNFTGTNFTTTSLVDDTNLLASCQSNIDIECAPTTIDQDRLRACETSANDYRTSFTNSFKGKSYEQICVAVDDPTLLRLEQEVKDCVEFTSTSVATLDSQLKECKKVFGNCRKAERNIIEYMFLCKGSETSCPSTPPIPPTPLPGTPTVPTTTTTCSTTTAACSCSCSCCS